MRTYLLTLMLAATLGLSTFLPGAATSQESGSREAMISRTLPADSGGTGKSQVASIDDYVRREGQARDLESFTGGRHEDVVIIGCSCAVVLIIVLILL